MRSGYSKPSSALIRLNLDERLACSGEHVEEPVKPAGIALSETDGLANRCRLNELLAVGDVRLEPGEYPIMPGVVIDGHTLDLGGARLIGAVTPLYDGAYIELRGQAPCLRNGIFAGHYSAAPGEEGYNHVEYDGIGIETAVGLPVGDFSDALIEGVTFEHVSGYVICPRWDSSAVKHASSKEAAADGWQRFALTPGYPLITARHGIGYGYQISTEPVRYRFYAEGGDLIGEASGIPGEAICVPDGAVKVEVLTAGNYVPYVLFEYRYDNSLTLDGCTFRCNQRLGVVNLPGMSVVRDCVSVSNGYPREDHTGITWDCSTTGFIDVEDVQSPRLTVISCKSENENLGVASRAYELRVEDSPELVTRLYGGWRASVHGSGPIIYNSAKVALSMALDTDRPVDEVCVKCADDLTDVDLGDLHLIPMSGAVWERCRIHAVTTGHLWYGVRPAGTMRDCDITLDADWILSHGNAELTFERCRVRLNGHHLIDNQVFAGSTLTFIDCDIDEPGGIATGLPGVKVVVR